VSTWAAPVGAAQRVRVQVTERSDGDLSITGEPVDLTIRRRSIVDRPWVVSTQVHGATVSVLEPGQPIAEIYGARSDAIVTTRTDVAIAAHSADCATVALWSPEGVIGVVHAGWRGLHLGVIAATVAAMGDLGASSFEAYLGPRIGPECYEFGADDLAAMALRFDDGVVSETASGVPALDVTAAVVIDLDRSGVRLAAMAPWCTACEQTRFWSHRARGETARQALVVWIES
jgi:polyphenol oxidase